MQAATCAMCTRKRLEGLAQTPLGPTLHSKPQAAVVDCLDDPDDTLRFKTLDLLSRLTKANNVEVQPARMPPFSKPMALSWRQAHGIVIAAMPLGAGCRSLSSG